MQIASGVLHYNVCMLSIQIDFLGIFITAFPLSPFALQVIYIEGFFSEFLTSLHSLLLIVKCHKVTCRGAFAWW